jgi:hypothetical protein
MVSTDQDVDDHDRFMPGRRPTQPPLEARQQHSLDIQFIRQPSRSTKLGHSSISGGIGLEQDRMVARHTHFQRRGWTG